MNRNIIWRTLAREKAVSLITILFITVAAMLLSLAAMLTATLTGAVDRLMLDAKTPHFMQMHSGAPDMAQLEAFAGSHSDVADFQVCRLLNADAALLAPLGHAEYLITFRLHDLSQLGAFEAAYSAAGLPANGPSLTWPLFRMLSAVSDGMMIAVLVLIGILVILVALLCVRFTLLAKIEDDSREIGVMKAIGMRTSDIRAIYLSIYAAIAAIGSGLGFFLSLLLRSPLQEGIRLNLGEGNSNAPALLLGAFGAGLVLLLILLSVNGSLRRFRNISAVQAIRAGAREGGARGAGAARLSGNRVFSVNLFLGIQDILVQKRLYATMLAVVVLAGFIMIVPQNLYHTISGDDFIACLGVGNCDLRMDIQQTAQIDQKTEELKSYLEGDPEIAACAVFVSKRFSVRLDDGGVGDLKVELGDHTVFPLQYAQGRMPLGEDEIALSALCAEELGLSVGTGLSLLASDGEKRLTVCGIYSDITNGGKTAKAVFADAGTAPMWSVACASLAGEVRLPDKIAAYASRFPYAKISGIDEYLSQTFGQTLRSVRAASMTAVFVAAAMVLLVTLLFMKLLTAKDRDSIVLLRAVGFTGSDIRRQYAWRAGLILTAGILLGTILSGTLGARLCAAAISAFGAATFRFAVNPLSSWLFSPLILLFSGLLATVWGTYDAGEVSFRQSIRE